jgi:glyoxylase-like metal-dependent hydrolase (beta-lactamase superfamily II)
MTNDAAQHSIWVFYKVDNMISEIQNNFYRITLRMPYRLKHVHAYLLAHDGELALFDTGLNIPGAYEMLEKDLTSAGFSIHDIRYIFLTHVHTDHCSMAGLLQKNTDAKVYLSAMAFAEYEHFRQIDPAVEQLKKFYSTNGMPSDKIDLVIEEYEDIRSIITDFHADDFLQNNEIREFGNWKFEVIFTPGHATGHVCFLFRKEGFLLAGDHILPYIAPILSPDIFDDDFRPLATYLDSLNDIEKLPIATIYPGHGNAFIDFKERLEEIRHHHKKRKKMIFDHLSTEPKTTYAVSHEIFGSELTDFDKFLALNETLIYLKELKFEGAIKENMADNVLVYTA